MNCRLCQLKLAMQVRSSRRLDFNTQNRGLTEIDGGDGPKNSLTPLTDPDPSSPEGTGAGMTHFLEIIEQQMREQDLLVAKGDARAGYELCPETWRTVRGGPLGSSFGQLDIDHIIFS